MDTCIRTYILTYMYTSIHTYRMHDCTPPMYACLQYRAHLEENRVELAALEKRLRESVRVKPLRREGINWSTREYMLDENADKDAGWSGPLPFKPYRLQDDLYGAVPGTIEDIFDPLNVRRRGGDLSAILRPHRSLGQSQIDLFKKVEDSGKAATLFDSKSLEEFLTSTDGLDEELTNSLRGATTVSDFEDKSRSTSSTSRSISRSFTASSVSS